MVEILGGPREPQLSLSEKEIVKRERDYNKVLRRLSDEQQGLVTGLTSIFSEWDIYQQYRGNIEKVEELSESLGRIGLKKNQRSVVLRYLNLS